jgi:hypothetical protein
LFGGQHGDATVAMAEQVSDGGVSWRRFIQDYRASVNDVGDIAIDEHHRQAGANQTRQIRIGCSAGGHKCAIDLPGLERLEIHGLACCVLVSVAQNEFVAVRLCDILRAPRDGGVERVPNVRHDQADGIGAFQTQRSRSRIRLIIKIFDSRLHSRAELGGNKAGSVQNV